MIKSITSDAGTGVGAGAGIGIGTGTGTGTGAGAGVMQEKIGGEVGINQIDTTNLSK